MGLYIQRGRSKWFYGRATVNGSAVHANLGVKIQGSPPASLRDLGDPLFERSRSAAQRSFDRWMDDLTRQATAEELAQKVVEARTGRRITPVLLRDLAQKWAEYPRSTKLSERYVASGVAGIRRFVEFMSHRFPFVKDLALVTEEHARVFLCEMRDQSLSPKRTNDVVKLLRSCFNWFGRESGVIFDPFARIPVQRVNTVHRKPFSPEELWEIFAEAKKSDPEIYALVVIAACSAMRLGDCVRLRWECIDLEGGWLSVQTAKTGAQVNIPIGHELKVLLESIPVNQREGVVFPRLLRQYEIAPDVLLRRFRRVLTSVGITNHTVEIAGDGGRVRKVSLRDFHSFRTTWVTIALSAGVPEEIVRKVTGHKSVDLVRENYNQPERETISRILSEKLPAVISRAADVPTLSAAFVLSRVASMSEQNWREVQARLLELAREHHIQVQ